MNNNSSLNRLRRWPRWTIIPIAIALALFSVVLGLLLEPAADALSPVLLTPTPTMPAISYGQGLSGSCHDCHFSISALESSAADPSSVEGYLIQEESVETTHGKLGCLACHGGDGKAADKEAAHQGLIADMTAQGPETCVICHQDLPDEIPQDRLRVPHGTVVEGIEQGAPCGVHCSDCHGGVGHGFDPVSGKTFCSMKVCLDCHQEQNLEVQMVDCDACHLGPHTSTVSLRCNDCHTSTGAWQQVSADAHPVPLPGKHGETECFACHQYPDFEGLSNVCADCHESGHTDWGDNDCAGCHDPGAGWEMTAEVWEEHSEHWDQYKGKHLEVSCEGCHFDGYFDKDSSCDACHDVPESHVGSQVTIGCTYCHEADRPWEGPFD